MNRNNHRRVRRKSFDRRRPAPAMRRPDASAAKPWRTERRHRSGRAGVLRRMARIGRRMAVTRHPDE